jgi:hypothetical protein
VSHAGSLDVNGSASCVIRWAQGSGSPRAARRPCTMVA